MPILTVIKKGKREKIGFEGARPLSELLDGLDGFFSRGTREDRIYYPHWENNALTVENSCMLWALFAAVTGGISAAAVIVMVMASTLKLSKFLSELRERHRR